MVIESALKPAQTEVQAWVAGRFEAAVGPNFGALRQAPGFDFHPGPEPVTIGLPPTVLIRSQ